MTLLMYWLWGIVALSLPLLLIVKDMYDYVFPENGLVAYHNGELFSKMVSVKTFTPNYL